MNFVISDTHFGHASIIKYCNRPFMDVTEMDNALVNNWNGVVGRLDTVYHLGDFGWPKKLITEMSYRLNGKIILIRGNHDRESEAFYTEIFFEFHKSPIEYRGVLLAHYPEESVHKKGIVEHYWNGEPWRGPVIHGHIHDNKLGDLVNMLTKKKKKRAPHYNVSCEVTGYAPVPLDPIVDMISKEGF